MLLLGTRQGKSFFFVNIVDLLHLCHSQMSQPSPCPCSWLTGCDAPHQKCLGVGHVKVGHLGRIGSLWHRPRRHLDTRVDILLDSQRLIILG